MKELKYIYRDIAQKRGTAFLSASDIVQPRSIDDEHLNEDGHRKFAEAVAKAVEEIQKSIEK